MNTGAIATREQIATTPVNPCGGGLSLWVNFREHFQCHVTRIFKLFRSINSLPFSTSEAVSTLFHKPKPFVVFGFNVLTFAVSVEYQSKHEGTHDGANLTQDLAYFTQAKKGGWANV